ncbi:MAG: glycosyltransferase family 4 protein, partial [Syntrophobacterales bacterium]|nr:glycosyltransferase family 4 protein [Syntrophobacterales bacterium]
PDSNMMWFSLITKLFHKKNIVFLQADLILPPGIMNRILEKIFDVSMYISCTLADVITTYVEDYAIHCRSYKRHLNKFMPLLLPAGLVDRRIDQEIDEKIKRIRRAHKASALVGFAGRFVEQKAFDILLKAMPQVVRQHPGVHFLFAGQAPAYEDFFERHRPLWEASAPFITDLGLLKGEAKMNAYYHNLDLFVLSSRVEPFGIVQIEAIEHGVPLVVTDVPGARWIVKQSGFGVLAAPEDPDSLAAAIVTALKRGKAGFPGWEKAKAMTDKENFFRQFAAIEGRLFPDARPQG